MRTKEEHSEQMKKQYIKNRAKRCKYQREYREKNLRKVTAYNKKWLKDHPGYKKKWYKKRKLLNRDKK